MLLLLRTKPLLPSQNNSTPHVKPLLTSLSIAKAKLLIWEATTTPPKKPLTVPCALLRLSMPSLMLPLTEDGLDI